ncbi:MAG: Na(+)-translocating NADH-quinone reductase subunit C [Pseudomonadota bacterium]
MALDKEPSDKKSFNTSSPNKDSTGRVLLVAGIVCLVCAVFVATAAVALRPVQAANKLLDTQRNILVAAGLYRNGANVAELFSRSVEPTLVDLQTGEAVVDARSVGIVDIDAYDQKSASKDPMLSEAIPGDEDIASLKRKVHYAKVYMIRDAGGTLEKIVLPVSGYGLWSTMYGYLVLANDFNTVVGLTFTDHGETPGLGGEIDNPKWKAQWLGKKIYDEHGKIAAKLKKGSVNADVAAEKLHQVDGLAGATLTSDGVTRLVQYWLGDHGFGPFLKNLKQRRG